ncbi:MAG: NAD+ synthase [Candidatus Dormiibacterota bacterium]
MSAPAGPTEVADEPLDSSELALNLPLVESILLGFISNETTRVGFNKVAVGMSGGVDSSLVAALAARALGPENVIGVSMPYRASNPASLADAQLVAEKFEIPLRIVEITPQVDAYFERFPDADNQRRGNKMARERMTILYDVSLAETALVLGTSNKTELLLGYSTIFGDSASALNPIGDLYKSQVWQLSSHVGIPDQVIGKAPSADLWEGQSDESELGYRYAAVDRLLFHLVDRRVAVDELVDMGHDPAFVEAVLQRVRTNQYKRRPPIIAKVSLRTIDREFRYPRDWGV